MTTKAGEQSDEGHEEQERDVEEDDRGGHGGALEVKLEKPCGTWRC